MPAFRLSSRLCAIILAVTALAASPRSSAAQDVPSGAPGSADSLGFRRGQWGAIVGIDGNVAALGVLRFRSSRTAWVLNATAGGVIGEAEADAVGAEREAENAGFSARLGLRRYRAIERPVAVYSGAGLTTSASFMDVSSTGGDEISARMYGAGLYGELGVEYRAARYIALGVRSLADVTGRWGSETRQMLGGTAVRSNRRELGASVGRLEVLASLYF